MKRRLAMLVLGVLTLTLVTGAGTASAHECSPDESEPCHPTPVYPNWRPQYVPLLGVNDSRCEDETCKENRRDAQRWRDEWNCDTQFCIWLKFGFSFDDGSPQSVHGGAAGDHSLFEAAHSSEGHGTEEGNHDAHGGAIYYDLCLAGDAGTSYEDQAGACDGVEDTQVGLTILDHNPCGVPPFPGVPFPCIDEYHVVRPFDADYSTEQMEESQEQIQQDMEDPESYLCGYAGTAERDEVCQTIG